MKPVGLASSIAFGICIIIFGASWMSKRRSQPYLTDNLEKIKRYQVYLSVINTGAMTLATLMMLLTYFTPKIFNYCVCHLLFSLAIAFYIIGTYAMKIIFLLHCQLGCIILNYRSNAQKSYKILIPIMCVLGIISFALVSIFSDGKCITDEYGCDTTFSLFTGWVAIALLLIDIISLSTFMYIVYQQLQTMNPNNESTSNSIKIFFSFWKVMIIALVVSVTDISLNIAYPNYDTLAVFMIDCTVHAICNYAIFNPGMFKMFLEDLEDFTLKETLTKKEITELNKKEQRNDEIEMTEYNEAEQDNLETEIKIKYPPPIIHLSPTPTPYSPTATLTPEPSHP